MIRHITLLAMFLAIAGCNSETSGPAESGAESGKGAEGEVLGGTIDDSMIPLDQLRSQPPLEKAAAADGGEGDTSGDAAGQEGVQESADEASDDASNEQQAETPAEPEGPAEE
ncbi:hypothetical protein [Qipengyuania sp. JC766]|uniref:hypothetical protein n=1 Tax=Qipengyuania sp. JC766 TaxID=3232139 RepID=UPI00345A94C2